ncbi:MAG TPA: hypothetical protein VMN36_19250 [Verrucomicrobiales bacterium]|nr:hypothetical protein [Verrucomicrobiales bacterium]
MNPYGSLLLHLSTAALAAGGILWGLQQRQADSSPESQARIRDLQAEITRLRAELEENTPPPGEDRDPFVNPVLPDISDGSEALQLDLAYRTAELRGLPFASGPVFETVPFEKVYRTNQDLLRSDFPGDAFARTTRTFQAASLIDRDTSLEQIFLDHSDLFGPCALDIAGESVLVAEASQLDDPATSLFVVREILRLLQFQHFDQSFLTIAPEGQWDRFLAMRALSRGDLMIHLDDFLKASLPATEDAAEDAPATTLRNEVRDQLEAAAGTAPRFLRRLLLFPTAEGSAFCETLRGETGIDAAFADPPTCTSHVLHPELYLATPRYLPRTLHWNDALTGAASPSFDSALGEFLVREWLARSLDDARAAVLAESWDGDRCTLFEDDEGLHFLWGFLWRSEAAAQAFLEALTGAVPSMFAVTPDPGEIGDAEVLRFSGPVRVEILRPAPDRIFLVRAGSEVWAGKLSKIALAAETASAR